MILEKLEKSAIFISDSLFNFLPSEKPKLKNLKKVKIVAHRGIFDNENVFENSLPAFDACLLKENIYAIEFDIRWTKDLVPVVFHDAHTQRVFKTKDYISDLSFKDLQIKYPLIPSFKEVIIRYSKKIHFMIELKNEINFKDKTKTEFKKQFQVLLNDLKDLKPIKDFHIMGFNTDLFTYMSSLPPKTFLPIIKWNLKSAVESFKTKNFGGLTCHYLLFNKFYRELFKKNHLFIGLGYIDSINNFKIQCQNNTDWMFTNKADLLSDFLKKELQKFH